MSNSSNGGINSASTGGMAAGHPPLQTQTMLVAPATSVEKNTVRAAIMPIACWRIDDLRFEFDSSILLPDAADELKQLAALTKEHPGAPLSIFGHADPVGNDDYNKQLSGRRAIVLYGLLTRNVELWEKLASHPHGGDEWRPKAAQIMLEALGFEPGRTDGEMDSPSKEAVKAFQRSQGLKDDGDPGPKTRKALFPLYMDLISKDGEGKPFKLDKKAFLAQGADPEGKGDYQGCSEFNPILMFSQEENQEFSKPKNKPQRDNGNAPNRRVVVFLFRPGSKVTPARWPCPRAKDGVAACRKRFWSDADKRRSFQAERREFAKTKDTFACRFYDRIAGRSPCEAGVERSMPTFFTIEQPGASNFVRMHSLFAYVAHFRGSSNELERVERFQMREGKLFDTELDRLGVVHCNRDAFLYFSHRDDLLELDHAKFFARDKSGLPLLGPIRIPCGPDAKVELDIWQQRDWAIVRGPRVDGVRPGVPKMAEWREDYSIGQLLPLKKGGVGFFPNGDQRMKMRQERWKGSQPIDLLHLGNPNGNPMWVGTLSALPSDKAKILLIHSSSKMGDLFVGSYNELAPDGNNHDLPGHHQFDQALVRQLLALPRSDQPDEDVDALPNPPGRFLLPGDMCWQDQGETNNCGPFSFSTAMNYWMPYTNNPGEKDGALYAKPGNVDDTINGARTPKDIVVAAGRFRMNGRDNDAEELDRARALKLLRLWLVAGVPVVFLVEEEYGSWNLHWKTLVGYDGNRFFMNNSGADAEVIRANRTPGVDYEKAPVGNDVDSESAFYDKWQTVGTGPLGAPLDLFTSVDESTFIPLFPQDPMFAGSKVK